MLGEARRRGLDTVLDPRSVDLSTVGGFAMRGVADLAWAAGAPHTAASLRGAEGVQLVRRIVDEVEARGHSAVLAPTHLIEGPGSAWLDVDTTLTVQMRSALDSRGLKHVAIYYPLVARTSSFASASRREEIAGRLVDLPVDAVWLRLHPFGASKSGPLALRRYIELCREFHPLGFPLVSEHSGTAGVALLAFGAVGGIESGITMSETVDLDRYVKPPDPNRRPFLPPPRVYLHELGAFVEPRVAQAFFGVRGMKSTHGCMDSGCCSRGWRDMLLEPRRHFITQRAHEVAGLSRVPETLRPGRYMESFLRPASDRAIRAAEVEPKLEPTRKRLESWRGTLGRDLAEHPVFSMGLPAAGKRLRRSA